ncbi:MAG: alpha-galactosidase [Clostridia bacterium]|nr:alpha-galactosidase [Clostridia bacterium]
MNIEFNGLNFLIKDGRIRLTRYGDIALSEEGECFVEVHLAGEHKDTHMGAKMTSSSEGDRLRYVTHTLSEESLDIVQRSEKVQTVTHLVRYGSVTRIYTEVKNISNGDIIIEEASAFVLGGIGSIDETDSLSFTRFTQSHHAECQPISRTFREEGLFRANDHSQKRIGICNVGSWSTKEALPQGIIEDRKTGASLMFEIESSASWYLEIADKNEKYYLWLGGPTLPFGGFEVCLGRDGKFVSPTVAIVAEASVHDVIAGMTDYRRALVRHSDKDATLPTIFNEYMHLSWDSPTAENTRALAPEVAKLGVKYYVIDCGWHNEEPGKGIYPYVGQWKESHARFPLGVRETTDYIRSLGMKAGLWIEPEIIGIKCTEMLDYYDDSCFMQRHGKRLSVMGRHFLDYRSPKVREYMSETIRRMVEDYGADYIKFDYNQDCGVGTDYLAFSAAEGLMECADAFLGWVREMTERFPDVIFEGCASGGMRLDYKSLSEYSLVSTSDQINYLCYPYIAGNILAAVVPEQAAVWSYPVATDKIEVFDKDKEWVEENISEDRIVLNMVNSLLGRMHLASHVDLLSEKKRALIREGIEYYDTLTEVKRKAHPYFPEGFTTYGAPHVAAGLITEERIYLAVWCLHGESAFSVELGQKAKAARVAYPTSSPVRISLEGERLSLDFGKTERAVFLEIDL